MRRYHRYNAYLWGLGALLVLVHFAYAYHVFGGRPLWDFLRYFDHWAGWTGMICMAAAMLYVPRKKKWFTFGKVKTWYKFHVFTGVVGPVLIFLHAYGNYYGLGAWCLLATWLAMMTGVIGHFIYKRLPEELENRVKERERLLQRLEETQSSLTVHIHDAEALLTRLDKTGPLSKLANAPKHKLPRPTLAKNLKNLGEFWQHYRAAGQTVADMHRLIIEQASAQRAMVNLRERELLELLHLEHDTRTLIVLNEIYSLWRKAHVPISWFMWWLAALHVFAWMYY